MGNMGDFFILGHSGGPPAPTWDDPAKYPRAITVQDDECLLRLSEIERMVEKYKALQEELMKAQNELGDQINILDADMRAQRARLFPRLRELYPSVTRGFGFGYRKYDGMYYAVGWDANTGAAPTEPSPDSE